MGEIPYNRQRSVRDQRCVRNERPAFAGAIMLVFATIFDFTSMLRRTRIVAHASRLPVGRTVSGELATSQRLPLVCEHFRVCDDGVLDDFGEALFELAPGQRFQNIEIVNHERRMMNCADQVFSSSCVDSGLSAD